MSGALENFNLANLHHISQELKKNLHHEIIKIHLPERRLTRVLVLVLFSNSIKNDKTDKQLQEIHCCLLFIQSVFVTKL